MFGPPVHRRPARSRPIGTCSNTKATRSCPVVVLGGMAWDREAYACRANARFHFVAFRGRSTGGGLSAPSYRLVKHPQSVRRGTALVA